MLLEDGLLRTPLQAEGWTMTGLKAIAFGRLPQPLPRIAARNGY